jgi:tetratricopeptide (TPR) repeat protein
MAPGVDRDDALRRAEKLLRQGRLDAAIEEYARVVEAYPQDFGTLNALGDLYVRAARSHLALPLYLQVADSYYREGFFSKAAGFYKKVLKFEPHEETALVRLAELSAAQGLLVDARRFLTTVARFRRGRGDGRGADEALVRLGALDPGDLDVQVAAARAQARLAGPAAAGRLRALVADLERQGRASEAVALLREVAALDPSDAHTVARLVRQDLATGHLADARANLARLAVLDSSELLELLVTIELGEGRLPEALDAVDTWLDLGPAEAERVVAFACVLAGRDPETAWACADAAVDRIVEEGAFERAAGAIDMFLDAQPGSVPAMLRLVEVCVDGDLSGRMVTAQAELARAYLETGRAAEALAVAEDLAARQPDEPAHRALVDRAGQMLGLPAPDRRSETDWSSSIVDAVALLDDPPAAWPARAVAPGEPPAALDATAPGVPAVREATVGHEPVTAAPESREVGPVDSPGTSAGDGVSIIEVDLTPALNALVQAPAAPPEGARASVAEPLETVFAQFREDAEGDLSPARQLSLGETYVEAGMRTEARPLLEAAARDSRCQGRAWALLGRIEEASGRVPEAIDWLERAAEAPEMADAERAAVLRHLGALLDDSGEWARALAVLLEAETFAPGDRDARTRIARLSSPLPPGGEPSTR